MNSNNLFPNLTIDNLVNSVEQNEFDLSVVSNYMESYQAFLNYFKKIHNRNESIKKDDLIIGINFTYGWMPTIFKFKSSNFGYTINFDYPLAILNDVHQGRNIGVKELNILKSLFNNSIVGTSKLLHFIKPESYAIWDSRVCRYSTRKNKVHNYQVNDTCFFQKYLEIVRTLSIDPRFQNSVYQPFCKRLNAYHQTNYIVTPVRVLELILFLMDLKKHGFKNENADSFD